MTAIGLLMGDPTRRKKTAPASIDSRTFALTILKAMARAIVQTFGPDLCEAVIHDLSNLEHSIIWIEGDVTHRKIGDTMTNLGLTTIRSGKLDDLFGYRTFVEGKALHSSSIILRDGNDRPWCAFCINMNVTPMLQLHRFLDFFSMSPQQGEIKETFTSSAEDVLKGMIADATNAVSKPYSEMNHSERIELVRILEQKGVFQLRRAVPILARQLGTSRYTVYKYLANARADRNDNGAGAQYSARAGNGKKRSASQRQRKRTIRRDSS